MIKTHDKPGKFWFTICDMEGNKIATSVKRATKKERNRDIKNAMDWLINPIIKAA